MVHSNTSGRGSANKRKENVKIADKFKGHCPPHKIKDLEALVKQFKGDEIKIQAQIEEWWEQPHTEEEEWEDVSKKSSKRPANRNGNSSGYRNERNSSGGGGRGGYGRSGGGGRGGYGRGMAGGRGGGSERRSRDYEKGGRPAAQQKRVAAAAEKKEDHVPGPAPVKSAPPLQGAWGQRAVPVAPAAAAPAAQAPAVSPAPVAAPSPTVDTIDPEKSADVGVVTSQDPTPAGFVDASIQGDVTKPVASPVPKPVVSASSTGNVWATKGSAHLIQAEKPKPPPVAPSAVQEVQPKTQRGGTRSRQTPKQEIIVEDSTTPEESSSVTETALQEPAPIDVPIVPAAASDALENGLPASVNGANVNAAGWKPLSETPSVSAPPPAVEIAQPSPVGPVSVTSVPSVADAPLGLTDPAVPVEKDVVHVEEPVVAPTAPTPVEPLKPTTVLNMGHWETGEGEEAQSLDFGFGSFGPDNDVASVDETTISSTTNNVVAPQPTPAAPQPTPAAPVQPVTTDNMTAANTSTVSPARPPPGLGIGMPPMPANVVHVHELENKLESASLAAKKEESSEKPVETSLPDKKPVTSNLTTSTQTAVPSAQPSETVMPNFHQGAMSQNYPSYGGMTGMYNYNANAAVNGFMGVPTPPPSGPVLSSGVLPQQQKQQNVTGQSVQSGAPQGLPQQQGSLYGASAPVNSGSDNSANNETNASTAGIPPGMHGGMPYNHPLYYQQQYQMGQPHGVGYGYGYGAQFGGVQGGYGFQQVMGQGGGYGQPYDDQPQHHGNHNTHNNHHGGSNHQGGYNKNSGGGYRGRNSHHNNHNNHNHHSNQYQGQYNPQGHGGYGGQPYSMYNEHFSQRGAYGPSMDHYMQNSGYQSGFSNQEDDQQLGSKGKGKGNNRNNFGNNPNMHQYQQGPQQGGQSQQQPFGLQGGVTDSTHAPGVSNGGLSYQNWGNGL